MRQQELVLDYMQAYGSISYDKGITITAKMETGKNRRGEAVHFTRYTLGG